MTKRILVAVAWPYVNGNIHVGHLAGYLLPADVFTRYQRLRGNDVLMVSGSDCHGTPITVQADKEEITPEEVVKKYHAKDIELFEQYDLDYSLYTTTVTQNHKEVVQQLFLDLLDNDFIVKDVMKQYYSSEDDEFLPDRYVEGTCPHCDAKEQRSDQCENCGRWLSDGELINPVSKKTGKQVELKDTEHYFLDFEALQEKLEDYLEGKLDGAKKSEVWRNWVYKEASGWLKEGMKKRAITRDIDWGIDLPKDRIPEDKLIENIAKKKIYVWFEAVTGYLSAPQEWSEYATGGLNKLNKDVNGNYIFREYAGQEKDWKKWWLDEASEHYYFMGQDNLVFHTLMWPGQLMGAEKGYTLPRNVVVNKFMNFNDTKFSKSRNNIVDSKEIADKFGTDAVRYYIFSNMPENKESNFTWQRFMEANNNELVANLGNLINRILHFHKEHYDKELSTAEIQVNPWIVRKEGDSVEVQEEPIDYKFKRLGDKIKSTFDKCGRQVENAEFSNAINTIMVLARHGNQLFDKSEIWKVYKLVPEKGEAMMYGLLNIVEALRILIRPFFSEAYQRLSEMLGVEVEEPEVGKDLFEFNQSLTTQILARLSHYSEKSNLRICQF
ncbi:methionine--tRNA ligase, partial [Candidatus Dojkabacteria bacterium]|nr:methionine--tRNA ligase [Candidatus Dojkabacteria bacterium]